jgi:hypothetical protein
MFKKISTVLTTTFLSINFILACDGNPYNNGSIFTKSRLDFTDSQYHWAKPGVLTPNIAEEIGQDYELFKQDNPIPNNIRGSYAYLNYLKNILENTNDAYLSVKASRQIYAISIKGAYFGFTKVSDSRWDRTAETKLFRDALTLIFKSTRPFKSQGSTIFPHL